MWILRIRHRVLTVGGLSSLAHRVVKWRKDVEMNIEEARTAAETGGFLVHEKNPDDRYEIVGPCRIQISGVWCKAIAYHVVDFDGTTKMFVRTLDDCDKLKHIKADVVKLVDAVSSKGIA